MATIFCVGLSLAAFATLGDGGKKSGNRTLLTYKSASQYHNFTLKSGYNFRGNNILSQPSNVRTIMLNTVVTYQKGNATYILPLKKRVILDKVKFTPSQTPFRY